MNKEVQRIEIKRIKKLVLIILVCTAIGAVIFAYFHFATQARRILREAKNVQVSFEMLSIEYYSEGESIYNPNASNGMAQGVKERIDKLLGETGDILITRYDAGKREVTGFIYERNNYRVIYGKKKDGTAHYDVQYIIPVLEYEK